jgi:long-chain fatty acid transport protein
MNTFGKSLFSVALLLAATWARAGGLWISEFGSPSMGRASAGATSAADDASTALHNPASMSHVKGKQLMVTAEVIAS